MYAVKKTHSSKELFWLNWFLACVVLLLAGAGYRFAASRLKILIGTPIALPVPLSAFPEEAHGWTGKDVPIKENVQRVTGNDDFLNRLYINKLRNQMVNMYIAYSARPRTMSGHEPQVCYPGAGWVHDSTEQSEVLSLTGRKIPCLLHRFHRPAPETEEVVVLNFYILNGQLTCDSSSFSGTGWRSPNIEGNAARYVAQVQISSMLENSVRTAAKDMTDLILDFLPDENDKVRALEYTTSVSGDLK